MGGEDPPQPVQNPVRLRQMTRLPIFPLPGAIMFPGLQLPLHIFEPRYRAMVADALVRDRRIGMIQPQRAEEGAPLFEIGCVGRIRDVETMDDGRFNILLEGEARFRILRELTVPTAYRQVEAEMITDEENDAVSAVERAALDDQGRQFADAQGYSVDWESVARLDDQSLINGISQIAPFDPASKQALLEAPNLSARCALLIQLMQFYGLRDGGEDEIVTLQ